MNQQANRLTDWWSDQLNNQLTNRTTNQLTTQLTDKLTDQPINWPTNWPTNSLIDQLTDWPIYLSIWIKNMAWQLICLDCLKQIQCLKVWIPLRQGSTIIIKLLHVITYVCQNFGVRDVRVQIPKIIYQASYFLHSDFPNNFP